MHALTETGRLQLWTGAYILQLQEQPCAILVRYYTTMFPGNIERPEVWGRLWLHRSRSDEGAASKAKCNNVYALCQLSTYYRGNGQPAFLLASNCRAQVFCPQIGCPLWHSLLPSYRAAQQQQSALTITTGCSCPVVPRLTLHCSCLHACRATSVSPTICTHTGPIVRTLHSSSSVDAA